MRTALGAIVAWALAIASWAAYGAIAGAQHWPSSRDLLVATLYLGVPVPFVALMVHWPLLTWLTRRGSNRLLVAAAGAVLALPLALWPVLSLGGHFQDVGSRGSQFFAVPYTAFGLFLGLWMSTERTREATKVTNLEPRTPEP